MFVDWRRWSIAVRHNLLNNFESAVTFFSRSTKTVMETKVRSINKILCFCFLVFAGWSASAQNCYRTSIVTPSPFMGNNDEIFKTADGRFWQIKYEYSYLYEYYPDVDICNNVKLIIKGKSLNIVAIGGTDSQPKNKPSSSQYPVKVIFKRSGCRDYFLADGDVGGIYLLEWYGGYDPSEGDSIVGEFRGYGFKDVFYPNSGSSGRVWVDDYMLSRSSAIEKIREKCR